MKTIDYQAAVSYAPVSGSKGRNTSKKPNIHDKAEYALCEALVSSKALPLEPLRDYSNDETFNKYVGTFPLTTGMAYIMYSRETIYKHLLNSEEHKALMVDLRAFCRDNIDFKDVDVKLYDFVENEDGSRTTIHPHTTEILVTYQSNKTKISFDNTFTDKKKLISYSGPISTTKANYVAVVTPLDINLFETTELRKVLNNPPIALESRESPTQHRLKRNKGRPYNSVLTLSIKKSSIAPYIHSELTLPSWFK